MLRYAETKLHLPVLKEENKRTVVYMRRHCWGPDL